MTILGLPTELNKLAVLFNSWRGVRFILSAVLLTVLCFAESFTPVDGTVTIAGTFGCIFSSGIVTSDGYDVDTVD